MGGTVRSVSRQNSGPAISPRFVGFTISVYLAFAVGYLLFVFALVFAMPGGGSTTTTTGVNSTGFMGLTSLIGALSMGLLLAPFVALVAGLFTGIGTDRRVAAAMTGFVGSAAGFLLMLVLVVLLAALLAGGGGFGGLGELLPMALAISVATGITGALSAVLSNHYQ